MSTSLRSLSRLKVGEPLRFEGLSVFPLFPTNGTPVDYQLADEAVGAATVVVQEVGAEGSVPDLVVENKGDTRVLFLEGEQLVGAKQNRVLNTSVLIAARSKVKIPVSCVERGRWRYSSPQFGFSGHGSHSNLRYVLKGTVTQSLKEKKGHRSDQGEVWKEVDRQQQALGASSQTAAMTDTYETYQKRIDQFRAQLRYVEGCTGMAVAVGPKVVCFDLFDKPSTCRKVWDRLLSGFTMDALEAQAPKAQADAATVARALSEAGDAAWSQAESVGEGEEYRTEYADHQGSALCCGEAPVHVSVLAAR